ncbi:hypothetical protein BDV24DRAFT_123254 [Aspergillus arachidicola]|uniref:Uncharacterized protein n=1 Tax=Aspergillus arachidicola TaxID=656916 RepID=A0A5N6YP98_9EURO|nr:hypothetical protein BDV24DRAFT_123254 [Aspergillus arachidicola]
MNGQRRGSPPLSNWSFRTLTILRTMAVTALFQSIPPSRQVLTFFLFLSFCPLLPMLLGSACQVMSTSTARYNFKLADNGPRSRRRRQ